MKKETMKAKQSADGKMVLALSGELDHHSMGALRQEVDDFILRHRPAQLIFDFKQVQFMDSSGIGFVIGRYKLLKKQGGKLFVKNLSKQMDQVFRLSGLYQIIEKTR